MKNTFIKDWAGNVIKFKNRPYKYEFFEDAEKGVPFMKVYYRPRTDEIGVLEKAGLEDGGFIDIMDAGHFCYALTLNLDEWVFLGEL